MAQTQKSLEHIMKKGFKVGMLTAVRRIRKRTEFHPAKWLCVCDCGNKKTVLEPNLYQGTPKSCGCIPYRNRNNVERADYIEIMKSTVKNGIKLNEKGCWEWQGAKHRQGYGHLSFRNKTTLLHRVSWIIYKGEIPDGLKVCHSCDNPSCCNPEHLFLGTQKDNIKDCAKKKRLRRGLGDNLRKLTQSQVDEIRDLSTSGKKRSEIARMFGVKVNCIRNIIKFITWKNGCKEE
jgi:hypothetical protein